MYGACFQRGCKLMHDESPADGVAEVEDAVEVAEPVVEKELIFVAKEEVDPVIAVVRARRGAITDGGVPDDVTSARWKKLMHVGCGSSCNACAFGRRNSGHCLVESSVWSNNVLTGIPEVAIVWDLRYYYPPME